MTSFWLKGFLAFTNEEQMRDDPYASSFLKTNLMHPGTEKRSSVQKKTKKNLNKLPTKWYIS